MNYCPTQENTKNPSIIEDDEKNDNFINFININLNNTNIYEPKSSNYILNNYTFDEAIKYDMRELCKIFYIFLLSKQPIFHAFLFK